MNPKLATFLFFMFILGIYVIMHEYTHGVIYENYGCENITYGIRWPGVAYSTADCTYEERQNSLLAHNINEIVGYNIGLMLIVIIGLLWFDGLR